jgi:hypothetical protein
MKSEPDFRTREMFDPPSEVIEPEEIQLMQDILDDQIRRDLPEGET